MRLNTDKSVGSKLWDIVNYTLLSVCALTAIVPFLYILAGSFATGQELAEKGFILIPTRFTLESYRFILSTETISRSLLVSVYITVAGTALNLLLTSLMAYPLSRQELNGRKWIMYMVVYAMLFNGGMIPTYIVVKNLGLLNTYWAMLLPGAISAFNMIVMKNFFQQLPEGLEESAKIDGCNDLMILFRIVLPLSMPVIATLALFYGVGHWNTFFSAILYINDAKMWPVQVWLRQIVILSAGGFTETSESEPPPSQTIKMAVIVVSTVPILFVYPFLQKHFAKGALMGSVKG
jgi:putative aldouronate transport system permease protein